MLRDIGITLWTQYQESTKPRTQLMDLFIVYCFLLSLIQFLYMKLAGSFPFNACLAGFFCSLGVATLTICLRTQITNKDVKKSEERVYIEYLFCCLILFLVVFNYLG